jgi:hypothetical protein
MNRWVLGIVCMGAMMFAISMDMRDEDIKFARECAYGSLGYLLAAMILWEDKP